VRTMRRMSRAGETYSVPQYRRAGHASATQLPGLAVAPRPCIASTSAAAAAARPAVSTAALASAGMPCAVSINRELSSPRLLLGEAWREWRGSMHGVLHALTVYLETAHSQAQAQAQVQVSQPRVLPQPVVVPSSVTAGVCAVALAGVLLGYPCAYDTAPPPSQSFASLPVSTVQHQQVHMQEDAEEDGWGDAGTGGHCLQGLPHMLTSCTLCLCTAPSPTASSSAPGTATVIAAEATAQAQIDTVINRIDFSYPKHVLPLYSLGGDEAAERASSSASASGTASATAHSGSQSTPAAARIVLLAHISSWKRRIAAAARTRVSVGTESQSGASSSSSGGQEGQAQGLPLIAQFSSREETPEAVAL
jgi:hypothetical protein